MAANRTNYLQNLVWRLHDYSCYTITPSTSTFACMQCNACCKCENDSRCSHSYLVGKNGDPQAGWMKEGVFEQTGCSFQVDKFQQLS